MRRLPANSQRRSLSQAARPRVARAVLGALFVGLPLLSVHCASSSDDTLCSHLVFHLPLLPTSHVEIVGDFNGWKRPGIVLDPPRAGNVRFAELKLAPGEQRYAILEDGIWLTDVRVGTSSFYQGHEVTWLPVADCHASQVDVTAVTVHHGVADVSLQTSQADNLSPERVQVASDSDVATQVKAGADGSQFTVTTGPLPPGRTRLQISLPDSKPRTVTVWNEKTAWDFRDAFVYQIVTDRYRTERDGKAAALGAPPDAGARAGGTLRGITSTIESGELQQLGVNTLWLSPLYKNPDGTFAGTDGRLYSSYHGYWPIAARELDARLGTEADLDALMKSAHTHGMRVLFDVVPNHVHQQHPYYHDQPDWFQGNTDGTVCVCGQGTCDWATHTESCWFTTYLPDANWRNDGLAEQATSDIAYWVDRFGPDGIRIDAVPMMPRAAIRRIAQNLRARYNHAGHSIWMVGENFTGPTSYDSLKYQLGPFGLDTEFHFPLMWALRSAVASGGGAMLDIADAVGNGEEAWAGSGAVMGLIIGNHDVSRFASVSSGADDGTSGWTPAPTSFEPLVYEKQKLGIGLTMTLPGAPFLYYGDEIALAGRNDPDARRVLPALESDSSLALGVRSYVAGLGRLRRCSELLRRGAYAQVYADTERFIFARVQNGRAALVMATRQPAVAELATPLPNVPAGTYVNVANGETLAVDPQLSTFRTTTMSLSVWLPAGDPCLVSP